MDFSPHLRCHLSLTRRNVETSHNECRQNTLPTTNEPHPPPMHRRTRPSGFRLHHSISLTSTPPVSDRWAIRLLVSMFIETASWHAYYFVHREDGGVLMVAEGELGDGASEMGTGGAWRALGWWQKVVIDWKACEVEGIGCGWKEGEDDWDFPARARMIDCGLISLKWEFEVITRSDLHTTIGPYDMALVSFNIRQIDHTAVPDMLLLSSWCRDGVEPQCRSKSAIKFLLHLTTSTGALPPVLRRMHYHYALSCRFMTYSLCCGQLCPHTSKLLWKHKRDLKTQFVLIKGTSSINMTW